MRPFNLKEYLNDPSRKIVTREGGEARIIRMDADDIPYPIHASVDMGMYVDISFYTTEGKRFDNEHESPYDLFFVPQKTEVGEYLKYLYTKIIFRIKNKKVKSFCYENLRNTHIKF